MVLLFVLMCVICVLLGDVLVVICVLFVCYWVDLCTVPSWVFVIDKFDKSFRDPLQFTENYRKIQFSIGVQK